MSNAELTGHIPAPEVIATTALGLHLARARNDSDYQKSGALRATMRDALRTHAATLPTERPSNIRFATVRKSIAA
jgi:hypothetical protein